MTSRSHNDFVPRLLRGSVLAVAFVCVIGSFSCALPTFFWVTVDEFRTESFAAPYSLDAYLHDGAFTPRYREIRRICRSYPPGTVGIEVHVYQILPVREREYGNGPLTSLAQSRREKLMRLPTTSSAGSMNSTRAGPRRNWQKKRAKNKRAGKTGKKNLPDLRLCKFL